MTTYFSIESPFNHRNLCWFCGEPKSTTFCIPHQGHVILHCIHRAIALPSCQECAKLAFKANEDNIWKVAQFVKQQLIHIYQKDLAIGVNWTPELLAKSQFEGGNFESFQQSAWFMFEVARERINFKGWPLIVEGIELLPDESSPSFSFDGVSYPSINDAVNHYAKAFGLSLPFLRQTVAALGGDRFPQAVRFCRLLIDATPDEKRIALQSLISDNS